MEISSGIKKSVVSLHHAWVIKHRVLDAVI